MNSPTPAVVTKAAARRLPRLALLLLCAVYLVPGSIGRDPWRNADLAAFGQMVAMAEGRTSWLAPTLGGAAADAALLPYWLGAAFIRALAPLVDAPLAARLAFVLVLAAVFALTWLTAFHLARTEAAQPVPFAFGGEADPVDYARAIADAALLALIATLGLLQLGHETTPELTQLAGVALLLYALAAAPFAAWRPRLAVAAALPLMAGSGAPAMALGMGVAAVIVCLRSSYAEARRFAAWVGGATVAAVLAAAWLGTWRWRASAPAAADLVSIPRQWLWFLWPAWPLVLWALWRWRRHLLHRHLSVPLVAVVVALAANLAMAGNDRALMLGLPGFAVLAAFALPTLRRASAAAIDWFSVFFFSVGALAIWVVYSAMQTGVPAKPAANVAKLAPGFVPAFSALAFAVAVAGLVAWLWLVRWRAKRHRDEVWTSMVLPACGVALCWLLAMTLWLPILDYARSARPLIDRIAAVVPQGECITAPALAPALVAALEHFGRYRVDAVSRPDETPCRWQLRVVRGKPPVRPPAPAGWEFVAELRPPTERDQATIVYRRGR